MNIRALVRTVYLGYTLYALLVIGSTRLSLLDILPAVIFMWVSYAFFVAGYSMIRTRSIAPELKIAAPNWLGKQRLRVLCLIALSTMVASFVASVYYVGLTPNDVVRKLLSGESVYAFYQAHFVAQGIAQAGLSRAPFVGALFWINFVMLYSWMSFRLLPVKLTIARASYLAVVTLSFIYIGIARGTSYEAFIVSVLFVFTSLFRLPKIGLRKILREYRYLVVIMLLAIYAFVQGIEARGAHLLALPSLAGVHYDPQAVIFSISPFIGFIVVVFYGYFGHGFAYMSTFVSSLWLSSFGSFIAGLLPMGYEAIFGKSITEIMPTLIFMGAKWHPDSILLIDRLGVIGVLVGMVVLGTLAAVLQSRRGLNAEKSIALFFIFLQMISFPVGNFVQVSSANRITIVAVVCLLALRQVVRNRHESLTLPSSSVREVGSSGA